MLLNKHQIFAANDLTTEIIAMPEWGGDIKVRVMSVGEQLEFDKFMAVEENNNALAFYLIIKSCIDEDGKPIFNNDDIEMLKNKNSESIIKLFNAILALNKQKPEDVDKLAKNS